MLRINTKNFMEFSFILRLPIELYVVTNRIDLAKERLNGLESCNCEEYDELKEIIAGTKESKY